MASTLTLELASSNYGNMWHEAFTLSTASLMVVCLANGSTVSVSTVKRQLNNSASTEDFVKIVGSTQQDGTSKRNVELWGCKSNTTGLSTIYIQYGGENANVAGAVFTIECGSNESTWIATGESTGNLDSSGWKDVQISSVVVGDILISGAVGEDTWASSVADGQSIEDARSVTTGPIDISFVAFSETATTAGLNTQSAYANEDTVWAQCVAAFRSSIVVSVAIPMQAIIFG